MSVSFYFDLFAKKAPLFSCKSSYVAYQMLSFVSTIQISCAFVAYASDNTTAFTHIIYTVFSAFRVYVLWHASIFKHLFFALILILGCVPIATNIVSSCLEDRQCHLILESHF